LKVVSESRVTYVGYLCANFSLPRPLCSQVRPDVCDRRQTKATLNAFALWQSLYEVAKLGECLL